MSWACPRRAMQAWRCTVSFGPRLGEGRRDPNRGCKGRFGRKTVPNRCESADCAPPRLGRDCAGATNTANHACLRTLTEPSIMLTPHCAAHTPRRAKGGVRYAGGCQTVSGGRDVFVRGLRKSHDLAGRPAEDGEARGYSHLPLLWLQRGQDRARLKARAGGALIRISFLRAIAWTLNRANRQPSQIVMADAGDRSTVAMRDALMGPITCVVCRGTASFHHFAPAKTRVGQRSNPHYRLSVRMRPQTD